MRRKRWLTVVMAVAAAAAVVMAATSYKEIGKKLKMQGEDQQTMLVAGYELQTEAANETEKNKKKSTKVSEKETQAGEGTETETASETETVKETETKETETETSAAVDPSKPVLKLKQKRVEIKAGDAFDTVSQVAEITDDIDDRSALFRQIEVHGDYSTDEPGTHTLTYTVTDSDGNVSAPVTLELVVKG